MFITCDVSAVQLVVFPQEASESLAAGKSMATPKRDQTQPLGPKARAVVQTTIEVCACACTAAGVHEPSARRDPVPVPRAGRCTALPIADCAQQEANIDVDIG